MSNILDNLLEARGLKFEDLHGEAREQYLDWLTLLESQPLTPDDMKRHISQEKARVEMELTDEPEFKAYFFGLLRRENRKHVFLKARLKNYLFLELFLASPETKKKAVEAYIDKLIKVPKKIL